MTPKQQIALLDEADAMLAKLKQAFPDAHAAPHLAAVAVGLGGLRGEAALQAQIQQQALAQAAS